MMKNPNHPPKGSVIKAEPVRSASAIAAIKAHLAAKPRDYCLFTLGINTGLTMTELLRLTAGQVRHLAPGDLLHVESGLGKKRQVRLFAPSVEAIQALLQSRHFADHEYLFQGPKGALRMPSVNRLVKQWCKAVGLKGNFGSQTLRKTFGYQQLVQYGVPLSFLMRTFNHATQAETYRFLCLKGEQARPIYANEI